jgi:hypothetical protein
MKEIGLDFLFNIYFLFKNVKFLLNSINYFLVFLSTAVDHPSSPTGFAGERARGGARLILIFKFFAQTYIVEV